MHIITRKRLVDFGDRHPQAREQLREWERLVKRKRYTTLEQVRRDFPSVDFVGPYRAIFNICHNDFRLVVDMRFDLSRAFIRHVVTHREYDRLIKRKAL